MINLRKKNLRTLTSNATTSDNEKKEKMYKPGTAIYEFNELNVKHILNVA